MIDIIRQFRLCALSTKQQSQPYPGANDNDRFMLQEFDRQQQRKLATAVLLLWTWALLMGLLIGLAIGSIAQRAAAGPGRDVTSGRPAEWGVVSPVEVGAGGTPAPRPLV